MICGKHEAGKQPTIFSERTQCHQSCQNHHLSKHRPVCLLDWIRSLKVVTRVGLVKAQAHHLISGEKKLWNIFVPFWTTYKAHWKGFPKKRFPPDSNDFDLGWLLYLFVFTYSLPERYLINLKNQANFTPSFSNKVSIDNMSKFAHFAVVLFLKIWAYCFVKNDWYGDIVAHGYVCSRFSCYVLSYFSLVFVMEQMTNPNTKSQLSRAIN